MSIADKEVFNPSKKIVIDEVLMRHGYNIKTDYIEEFYGTPLDENEPRTIPFAPELSATKGIDTSLIDFFV
jgi:hypothetical protein